MAGLLSLFFQPFFCQPYTHPLVTASTRYLLSLVRMTRQGCFRALKPSMAASSSMRLLVVIGSPPESSFSIPLYRKTAPQPPGPGLPEQAPSVNSCTSFFSVMVYSPFLWHNLYGTL